MNAIQTINDQEEAAEALMRDFGLSYTSAMILVLDAQNKEETKKEENSSS